jgi:beta-lactamase regulating signal transducer with metallopeptidase domain
MYYGKGSEMPNLTSYTLTSDISLNGKKLVKNEAPILSTSSELNNKYQGSFINYADGKGEKNGSGKDHVSVTGVTTRPVIGGATEATDVTKDGETPLSTILVILGIVVAVIAIVIVVILRRRFTQSEETNQTDQK